MGMLHDVNPHILCQPIFYYRASLVPKMPIYQQFLNIKHVRRNSSALIEQTRRHSQFYITGHHMY